jgi:hypothetical protein
MAPLAVPGGVAMNVAVLAGSVDIRCGLAILAMVATIVMVVLTIIIITARMILAVIITVMPQTVLTIIIAVVLTWAILAWTIILTRMIILTWATVILTRTGVMMSNVRGGDNPWIFRLVFTVKFLNLSKKIRKRSVRISTHGGTKTVVPTSKAMQDIVDKLIIIQWFSRRSKLRCNGFHLGKIFVSREIILAGVVEGGAKLLNPGLRLGSNMIIKSLPNLG